MEARFVMTWSVVKPPNNVMIGREGPIITFYIEDTTFRCGGYRCAWCKSRCETGASVIAGNLPAPDVYRRIMLNLLADVDTLPSVVSIQGAQPFHPLYLDHTKTIWEMAQEKGVPTAAVSSGDGVPEALEWIDSLPMTPTILISKDAPDDRNAELRGSNYAGQTATVVANAAMDALISLPQMCAGHARIATTIIKNQEPWAFDLIDTFPAHWKEAGVPIVFSPQLIEREGDVSRFAHTPSEFSAIVKELVRRCEDAGVEYFIDNVFDRLEDVDDIAGLVGISLEGRVLVRFGPDLSVREGEDVLNLSTPAPMIDRVTKSFMYAAAP